MSQKKNKHHSPIRGSSPIAPLLMLGALVLSLVVGTKVVTNLKENLDKRSRAQVVTSPATYDLPCFSTSSGNVQYDSTGHPISGSPCDEQINNSGSRVGSYWYFNTPENFRWTGDLTLTLTMDYSHADTSVTDACSYERTNSAFTNFLEVNSGSGNRNWYRVDGFGWFPNVAMPTFEYSANCTPNSPSGRMVQVVKAHWNGPPLLYKSWRIWWRDDTWLVRNIKLVSAKLEVTNGIVAEWCQAPDSCKTDAAACTSTGGSVVESKFCDVSHSSTAPNNVGVCCTTTPQTPPPTPAPDVAGKDCVLNAGQCVSSNSLNCLYRMSTFDSSCASGNFCALGCQVPAGKCGGLSSQIYCGDNAQGAEVCCSKGGATCGSSNGSPVCINRDEAIGGLPCIGQSIYKNDDRNPPLGSVGGFVLDSTNLMPGPGDGHVLPGTVVILQAILGNLAQNSQSPITVTFPLTSNVEFVDADPDCTYDSANHAVNCDRGTEAGGITSKTIRVKILESARLFSKFTSAPYVTSDGVVAKCVQRSIVIDACQSPFSCVSSASACTDNGGSVRQDSCTQAGAVCCAPATQTLCTAPYTCVGTTTDCAGAPRNGNVINATCNSSTNPICCYTPPIGGTQLCTAPNQCVANDDVCKTGNNGTVIAGICNVSNPTCCAPAKTNLCTSPSQCTSTSACSNSGGTVDSSAQCAIGTNEVCCTPPVPLCTAPDTCVANNATCIAGGNGTPVFGLCNSANPVCCAPAKNQTCGGSNVCVTASFCSSQNGTVDSNGQCSIGSANVCCQLPVVPLCTAPDTCVANNATCTAGGNGTVKQGQCSGGGVCCAPAKTGICTSPNSCIDQATCTSQNGTVNPVGQCNVGTSNVCCNVPVATPPPDVPLCTAPDTCLGSANACSGMGGSEINGLCPTNSPVCCKFPESTPAPTQTVPLCTAPWSCLTDADCGTRDGLTTEGACGTGRVCCLPRKDTVGNNVACQYPNLCVKGGPDVTKEQGNQCISSDGNTTAGLVAASCPAVGDVCCNKDIIGRGGSCISDFNGPVTADTQCCTGVTYTKGGAKYCGTCVADNQTSYRRGIDCCSPYTEKITPTSPDSLYRCLPDPDKYGWRASGASCVSCKETDPESVIQQCTYKNKTECLNAVNPKVCGSAQYPGKCMTSSQFGSLCRQAGNGLCDAGTICCQYEFGRQGDSCRVNAGYECVRQDYKCTDTKTLQSNDPNACNLFQKCGTNCSFDTEKYANHKKLEQGQSCDYQAPIPANLTDSDNSYAYCDFCPFGYEVNQSNTTQATCKQQPTAKAGTKCTNANDYDCLCETTYKSIKAGTYCPSLVNLKPGEVCNIDAIAGAVEEGKLQCMCEGIQVLPGGLCVPRFDLEGGRFKTSTVNVNQFEIQLCNNNSKCTWWNPFDLRKIDLYLKDALTRSSKLIIEYLLKSATVESVIRYKDGSMIKIDDPRTESDINTCLNNIASSDCKFTPETVNKMIDTAILQMQLSSLSPDELLSQKRSVILRSDTTLNENQVGFILRSIAESKNPLIMLSQVIKDVEAFQEKVKKVRTELYNLSIGLREVASDKLCHSLERNGAKGLGLCTTHRPEIEDDMALAHIMLDLWTMIVFYGDLTAQDLYDSSSSCINEYTAKIKANPALLAGAPVVFGTTGECLQAMLQVMPLIASIPGWEQMAQPFAVALAKQEYVVFGDTFSNYLARGINNAAKKVNAPFQLPIDRKIAVKVALDEWTKRPAGAPLLFYFFEDTKGRPVARIFASEADAIKYIGENNLDISKLVYMRADDFASVTDAPVPQPADEGLVITTTALEVVPESQLIKSYDTGLLGRIKENVQSIRVEVQRFIETLTQPAPTSPISITQTPKSLIAAFDSNLTRVLGSGVQSSPLTALMLNAVDLLPATQAISQVNKILEALAGLRLTPFTDLTLKVAISDLKLPADYDNSLKDIIPSIEKIGEGQDHRVYKYHHEGSNKDVVIRFGKFEDDTPDWLKVELIKIGAYVDPKATIAAELDFYQKYSGKVNIPNYYFKVVDKNGEVVGVAVEYIDDFVSVDTLTRNGSKITKTKAEEGIIAHQNFYKVTSPTRGPQDVASGKNWGLSGGKFIWVDFIPVAAPLDKYPIAEETRDVIASLFPICSGCPPTFGEWVRDLKSRGLIPADTSETDPFAVPTSTGKSTTVSFRKDINNVQMVLTGYDPDNNQWTEYFNFQLNDEGYELIKDDIAPAMNNYYKNLDEGMIADQAFDKYVTETEIGISNWIKRNLQKANTALDTSADQYTTLSAAYNAMRNGQCAFVCRHFTAITKVLTQAAGLPDNYQIWLINPAIPGESGHGVLYNPRTGHIFDNGDLVTGGLPSLQDRRPLPLFPSIENINILDVYSNQEIPIIRYFLRDLDIDRALDALRVTKASSIQIANAFRAPSTIVDLLAFYDKSYVEFILEKAGIARSEFGNIYINAQASINNRTIALYAEYTKEQLTKALEAIGLPKPDIDNYINAYPDSYWKPSYNIISPSALIVELSKGKRIIMDAVKDFDFAQFLKNGKAFVTSNPLSQITNNELRKAVEALKYIEQVFSAEQRPYTTTISNGNVVSKDTGLRPGPTDTEAQVRQQIFDENNGTVKLGVFCNLQRGVCLEQSLALSGLIDQYNIPNAVIELIKSDGSTHAIVRVDTSQGTFFIDPRNGWVLNESQVRQYLSQRGYQLVGAIKRFDETVKLP